MRVLVGPGLDLQAGSDAARLCARLAGEDGQVVSLAAVGYLNPFRRLSAAEVDAIRGAVRGETGVVGLVCRGRAFAAAEGAVQGAAGSAAQGAPRLVVVADHVNLTWRSPLAGPNDDRVGPRFPAMDGIYAPEAVERLLSEEEGMIVVCGVVAGVPDHRALGEYEVHLAARLGWVAACSELVAPAIIAAHMGLRVAAVVMV
jgi:hypothetical protein